MSCNNPDLLALTLPAANFQSFERFFVCLCVFVHINSTYCLHVSVALLYVTAHAVDIDACLVAADVTRHL